MNKVLIIEDKKFLQDGWKRELEGKAEVISALSIAEAEKQFFANPDIVAIVMDACVPGEEPTTLPLVRKFRATFTGPMIAISGSQSYRNWLLQAGCDHECPKHSVVQTLTELLGL